MVADAVDLEGLTHVQQKNSPFANQCQGGAGLHNCTIEDPDVKRCMCGQPSPDGDVKKVTGQTQCFWPGPAYDWPRISDTDHTRDMVKARLEHQGEPGAPLDPALDGPGDGNRDRLSYWNEVVIDDRILMTELERDPAAVIPAFIYVTPRPAYAPDTDNHKEVNTEGLITAKASRETFMKEYMSDMMDTKIPLIAINDLWPMQDKNASGPFSYKKEDDEAVQIV